MFKDRMGSGGFGRAFPSETDSFSEMQRHLQVWRPRLRELWLGWQFESMGGKRMSGSPGLIPAVHSMALTTTHS